MLEVKATKTFDEVLRDNPNLYAGCVGYSWNEAENSWKAGEIAESTKQLIEEWFGLRVVCHDDHFERFFRRAINGTALRYAQLRRIELSAFDPLVANYAERERIEDTSKTTTANNELTKSGSVTGNGGSTTTRKPDLTTTDSGTRTPDLKELTEGENSQEHSTTTGGTNNTTHTGSHDNDTINANKNAPQSISYQAQAGEVPALDWTYMTAQGQTKDRGTEDAIDTNTTSGTESGSQSGDNKQTVKTSGTETTAGTSTTTGKEVTEVENTSSTTTEDRENAIHSGSEIGNGRSREIETGRSGLTPQEAFREAVSYLKTSSAFAWLKQELEPCFFCIYDI